MGQAKNRGSKEERIRQAKIRASIAQSQSLVRQDLADLELREQVAKEAGVPTVLVQSPRRSLPKRYTSRAVVAAALIGYLASQSRGGGS